MSRCHHPSPVESALCLAIIYFNEAPLPHMTSWVFTPCKPYATSSLPPHPLPHHVGSQGRAGGQTCHSQHRCHAAIPQTPITTQQGRGLATAWQPHGPIRVHNNRDQRKPRKVSESVRILVYDNPFQVIKNITLMSLIYFNMCCLYIQWWVSICFFTVVLIKWCLNGVAKELDML